MHLLYTGILDVIRAYLYDMSLIALIIDYTVEIVIVERKKN